MAQTLEAIRGGGGSVKIGTTGKISALMSREIESTKTSSKVPSLSTSVSVSASDIAPKKLKSRTSVDEASTSGPTDVKSHKCPETLKKIKHHHSGPTHQIPMLGADNISLQGTPIRPKPIRRGPGVEIVDIRCGNPDKAWTNPITNRLKKLGFSKLSDNNG